MSNYFEITTDVKQQYADMISDMIAAMGKSVTIYYPGIMESCVNCIYDPIGKKSSNRYRTGGVMPFAGGLPCPICAGTGQRAKIVTETTKFLCTWNLNGQFGNDKYINVGNVRLPNGYALIRGPMSFKPKVESCDYIVINAVNQYRFKLDSEPIDPGNIVSDKFFSVVVKRV